MKVLITGVAGFVGSNLAVAMLQRGYRVIGLDNLSRGSLKNLKTCMTHKNFQFEKCDLSELSHTNSLLAKIHKTTRINELWHFAANSDIPAGIRDPNIELRNTFMTTFNVLETMKNLKIKKLFFASSSAIYGNHGSRSLTESTGPLLPISNYGAMKLAAEAIIAAAAESFLDQAFLFRFPNVIGVPATHGVILDFIRKLKANPSVLPVLGNGKQKKAYLHVDDLISAMLHISDGYAQKKTAVFNIAPDDTGVTVNFIARQTVKTVAPAAKIQFGLEDRGWPGDIPRFSYSIIKLKKLGWRPTLNSKNAVCKAIREIAAQEGI